MKTKTNKTWDCFIWQQVEDWFMPCVKNMILPELATWLFGWMKCSHSVGPLRRKHFKSISFIKHTHISVSALDWWLLHHFWLFSGICPLKPLFKISISFLQFSHVASNTLSLQQETGFVPAELQTASSPPLCSQCPPAEWPSVPARTAGSNAQRRTAQSGVEIQSISNTHGYTCCIINTFLYLGFYIMESIVFEAKPQAVIFLNALLH